MLYLESKSAWCKDIAIVLGVVALVSVAEIFLVNRKYGIFSGGFGQSRVLDSASDVLVFAVAYGIAQLFLAMIVWRISVSLTKKQPNWAAAFLLLVLMGGGFVLALSVQYKLHSYFSDAVSFALISRPCKTQPAPINTGFALFPRQLHPPRINSPAIDF